MIELTKQYKTRDGRDVRLLMVDGGSDEYPVIGALKNDDGTWSEAIWSEAGEFITEDQPDDYDLIEVKPEPKAIPFGEIPVGARFVYHEDRDGGEPYLKTGKGSAFSPSIGGNFAYPSFFSGEGALYFVVRPTASIEWERV